ncbi:LptF/LptG family permease [Leptobacterium sp. I13]|uniref:LptF/LptG family permease n=1 Tax=Leptobacterium meishanense TaxID=3128904 RepID=UPI0030EF0B34
MRILDRYILSRFLFNFTSSFVILMFIFIFQAIWFFVEEFAGKGLDLAIIGKFLFYYSPTLINRVLPLTVLLSSIMTFGNLAENYEFAAMKASGVSLQRAMRSLIIFVVVLGIGTFFFANNVIPEAEYKSYNLRRNIAKLKPALAINEGIFNEVGEINIKVDEKYGENDNFLRNVIIHKKTSNGENKTVIKAKEGELKSSEDSEILNLVLKDGNYYEDVKPSSAKDRLKYPHAKAHFEYYTINVDLRELNNVDLNEEKYTNLYKMLNVKELGFFIDSITIDNRQISNSFGTNIYSRMGLNPTLKNIKKNKRKDTTAIKERTISTSEELVSLFDEWRQTDLLNVAIRNITNTRATIEGKKSDLLRRDKLLNHHIMALHEKYALAFACVILFFVGAPLGAIIRKGGLGLPMVIAIVLFLTYYFIDIFSKNYAENGNISPVIGPWVSTLIMLPLSVLLTRRATADKGIFDTDGFIERFKSLFGKLKIKRIKG